MKFSTLISFAAGSLAAVSATGQVVSEFVIGGFESGLDGWAVSGFTTDATRAVAVSTTGATVGAQSLAYTAGTGGGYQWAIQNNGLRASLGSNLDLLGTAEQILLSFDVSTVASEWSTTNGNWIQAAEVVYNSQSTGFNSLTRGNAVTGGLLTDSINPGFPAGWNSASNYTTTLTWDVTSIFASASSSDGWAELGIAVNFSGDFISTGNPGIFYFDNITLTGISASPVPEPSTYALLAGLGILGFIAYRRRRVQTAA